MNSTSTAANGLTPRVRQALEALEWQVEADPDLEGGLHLAPSDGDAPWPLVAAVVEGDAAVVVYSVLPDDVVAERRGPVLQVLNVANLVLDAGCFDIDPDDGEVRLRTTLDLAGVEVDDEQLRGLLGATIARNLHAMDAWFDAVRDVAGGAELRGPTAE